jgi:O-succinylbenzoate synthase
MKIWHSPYQLYPKGSLNLRGKGRYRQGSLLRIEFAPGLIGYSDLCPFSGFGDQPIEIELNNLAREILSPITRRSLYFARLDAEAREQKKSLYGTTRITNHYLIGNILEFDLTRIPLLQGQRFQIFKVKMGSELRLETEMLQALVEKFAMGSKLRIDFNGKLGRERFIDWIDQNHTWLKPHLDYIEDPFMYDPLEWAKIHNKFEIDLAVDLPGSAFDEQAVGAQVVVIKPAVQDEQKIIAGLQGSKHRLVVTHYLDFPIGQMFAYVIAQKLIEGGERRIIECGLQHHDFYEGFRFQEEIKNDGPFIVPPDGHGIGFDNLLESQSWVMLR